MLGDFIAGPPDAEEVEEALEQEGEEVEEGTSAGVAAPAASSWWGGLPSVGLGGIAAAVKAQLDNVVQTAAQTDWRAELSALKEGLQDEGTEAVTVARGAVQQLPSAVDHMAEQLPASASMLSEKVSAAQHAASAGLHRLVEGTSHLFDQVSHAIQSELGGPEGSAGAAGGTAAAVRASSLAATAAAPYSRLEADIAAMQRDSATYCDEPEDTEGFAAWEAGFSLAERQPDIDHLIADNTFMRELQARIVPLIVEHDAFWTRYFYRLHLLELKHQKIAALTKSKEGPLGASGARDEEEEAGGWSSSEEDEEEGLAGGAGAERSAPAPAAAAAVGDADAPAVAAGSIASGEYSGDGSSWQEVEITSSPPAEKTEGVGEDTKARGSKAEKQQEPAATEEDADLEDDSWADSAGGDDGPAAGVSGSAASGSDDDLEWE